MKKNEPLLRKLINIELQPLRSKSYEDLRANVVQKKSDAYEVESDGIVYQIEIEYFWDNHPDGNIRVMGNINEKGSWSVFRPLSDDFIKAPDGSFVGE